MTNEYRLGLIKYAYRHQDAPNVSPVLYIHAFRLLAAEIDPVPNRRELKNYGDEVF